jgi:hypothetical protein
MYKELQDIRCKRVLRSPGEHVRRKRILKTIILHKLRNLMVKYPQYPCGTGVIHCTNQLYQIKRTIIFMVSVRRLDGMIICI